MPARGRVGMAAQNFWDGKLENLPLFWAKGFDA